jgi:hypothetical protein
MYSLPTIIRMIEPRRMGWAGHVARMGRGGMRIGFWWERQKERPLGRPRRRCMDNIRMGLRVIEWGDMELINLAQNRAKWKALVNTVMNFPKEGFAP